MSKMQPIQDFLIALQHGSQTALIFGVCVMLVAVALMVVVTRK